MANLSQVVKVTQAQYNTLIGGGTVSGQIYDPNAIYLVDSGAGISYITTAPSADNTDGTLIFVVLSSEPLTRYAGYIYLITEA